MKSIALISTLTFLAIFGTILITSGMFEEAVRNVQANSSGNTNLPDNEAAEMIFANMALERDRLQTESEGIIERKSFYDMEEKALADREKKIAAMLEELMQIQLSFNQDRDAQAVKLSKVYEAMKPVSAAPILSSLDLDIVLQILGNMKDRQAAKILAQMNPALAAEISTRMSAKGKS